MIVIITIQNNANKDKWILKKKTVKKCNGLTWTFVGLETFKRSWLDDIELHTSCSGSLESSLSKDTSSSVSSCFSSDIVYLASKLSLSDAS